MIRLEPRGYDQRMMACLGAQSFARARILATYRVGSTKEQKCAVFRQHFGRSRHGWFVVKMEPNHQNTPMSELVVHGPWMYRLARSLVGAADDADDLVQETFAIALKQPPNTDRPVKPWLRKVMQNVVFMRHRGDRRRGERETLVGSQLTSGMAPDEAAERLRAQQRLTDLVSNLEEPYRSTVIQRYVHGLSAAEIARAAGVPAGTVRWRLKQGLDSLRASLKDVDGGDRQAWYLSIVPVTMPSVGSSSTATTTVILGGIMTIRNSALVAALIALIVGAGVVIRSASSRASLTTREVKRSSEAKELSEQPTDYADETRELIRTENMTQLTGKSSESPLGAEPTNPEANVPRGLQTIQADMKKCLGSGFSDGNYPFDLRLSPDGRVKSAVFLGTRAAFAPPGDPEVRCIENLWRGITMAPDPDWGGYNEAKGELLYSVLLEPETPNYADPGTVTKSEDVRAEAGLSGSGLGEEDAGVVVTLFSSFGSRFCARAVATMDELREQYPNDVRFVFRHYPVGIQGDFEAAEAALAAQAQGALWEMHGLLFANQDRRSSSDFSEFAKELGLNVESFEVMLKDRKFQAVVDTDIEVGKSIGVTGTPTFVINGEISVGVRPLDHFTKIIDAQLASPIELPQTR